MFAFFNKLNKQTFIGFFVFFLSTASFATPGHFYLGGSGAASIVPVGSDRQISYFFGLITDSYPLNTRYATSAMLSLNGGYEFAADRQDGTPAIGFGLGVYGTPGYYTYNGQLTESVFFGPNFVITNFRYKVSSARVMAEGQLTWMFNKLALFINGGLGTSWNHVGGYNENPRINIPPFQSKVNTNLTFQAGFGMGYVFHFSRAADAPDSERIGVGYRYVDLGHATFGTRGTSYPFNLVVGNLISNEVYLSYTHLFL